jgi:EmrB/QacA subfamily drug resistance transporter
MGGGGSSAGGGSDGSDQLVADRGGMPTRDRVVLLALVLSALIVSIDTSLLTVAIPTLMREFDAPLSSVQWVLTGYSLVYASLLVIGGRLGDIHGHRRMFAIGGSLFALGSLVAVVSWSIPALFVGEALIEGVGACLMLPAATAMISTRFHGRDRATAFAMLGASMGLGTALGPLLGGFFVSQLSWRYGFAMNVLIAPCAVAGILAFVPRSEGSTARPKLDLLGAALLATGMLLLVFSLSEGGTYGWWEPREPFTIAGRVLWPETFGISVVPVAIAAATALLTIFVVVERRKERAARDPLMDFGDLSHPRFRYGQVTTGILAMGQLALIVVLSVFLQSAARLSAVEVGTWLVPMGVMIIIGSRLGGITTNRTDAVATVRGGLALQVVGIALVVAVVDPGVTFWALAPGLTIYGLGIGAASAQLVNVILSDVEPAKSGVASGTTSTVRQVGAALGIATISTILTSQSISQTAANIRASDLSATVQEGAITALDRLGTSFAPPSGTGPADQSTLLAALAEGVTDAARPALLFGLGALALGLVFSFLMPRPPRGAEPAETDGDRDGAVELFESMAAVEPLGEMLPERPPRSG